jgi:translation initiation factor 4G
MEKKEIEFLGQKSWWFYYLQPRMDQYFNQMEKIVKERKTSSRIRFMLQDVIDLRLVS